MSAYRKFEERVGMITTGTKGAKTDNVQRAVARLPLQFRFDDLRRACPGISDSLLRKMMIGFKESGMLTIGRGANARYEKTDSFDITPLQAKLF